MALAHRDAAGAWQSAPQIAAAVEEGLPRQALAYGYLWAAFFAGPAPLCADPSFRAQTGSYWSIMPHLQVRCAFGARAVPASLACQAALMEAASHLLAHI